MNSPNTIDFGIVAVSASRTAVRRPSTLAAGWIPLRNAIALASRRVGYDLVTGRERGSISVREADYRGGAAAVNR